MYNLFRFHSPGWNLLKTYPSEIEEVMKLKPNIW